MAKSEAEEAKARELVEARQAAEAKRLAQKQAAEEKARALAESKAQAKALADAKKAKGKTTTLADAKKASKPEQSASYKVNSGDTLYSIAKKYDMDVADLVAANGIKGNSIKTGQVLKVAAKSSAKVADKGKVVKTADKKDTDKKATKVASHTVKKGDTLESIAKRYKLDVGDLKRLNKNGNQLKPGQVVKLSS